MGKTSTKEILEARIVVIGGSFGSEYFGKNTYKREDGKIETVDGMRLIKVHLHVEGADV